jgi:hypothetical protein
MRPGRAGRLGPVHCHGGCRRGKPRRINIQTQDDEPTRHSAPSLVRQPRTQAHLPTLSYCPQRTASAAALHCTPPFHPIPLLGLSCERFPSVHLVLQGVLHWHLRRHSAEHHLQSASHGVPAVQHWPIHCLRGVRHLHLRQQQQQQQQPPAIMPEGCHGRPRACSPQPPSHRPRLQVPCEPPNPAFALSGPSISVMWVGRLVSWAMHCWFGFCCSGAWGGISKILI